MAEIKTKIAGLRAQLGRELSKTRTKRSGQGTSENYKPNWVYWDRLQFLVPVMQVGKSRDNLTSSASQPDLSKQDTDTESTTSDDSPSKLPVLIKPTTTTARSGIGKSKNEVELRRQELLSTCIQVLKEPMPQPQPTLSPFCQYVSEKLEQFDRRTRMIAEKRITDLLFELEINQPFSNPNTSFVSLLNSVPHCGTE